MFLVLNGVSGAEWCFCSSVVFQDNREVDRNEGLKFARKHSMLFIGTVVSVSVSLSLCLCLSLSLCLCLSPFLSPVLMTVLCSLWLQRPVLRPRTACSVPSRSWWRRSSRLQGCGRATPRDRASGWGTHSSRRGVAVEGTAPYPNWREGTLGTGLGWEPQMRMEERREGGG